MLLEAKVAQLTESFEHKLGYLVGMMYSRVGTEDWMSRFATARKHLKNKPTFTARIK